MSGSPLEAVAQAIWTTDHPNWGPTWESLTENDREYYRDLASAAIGALELREETERTQCVLPVMECTWSYGCGHDGTRSRWVSSWTSGSDQ